MAEEGVLYAKPTIRKANIPRAGDFVNLTKTGRVKKAKPIKLDEEPIFGIYLGEGRSVNEAVILIGDEEIDELEAVYWP